MTNHESGPEFICLPKGARILSNMSEDEYTEMCKEIPFMKELITINFNNEMEQINK